jgi:hypothetical protein
VGTIGCIGRSPFSNVADKLPRPTLVARSVEVNISAGVAPRVAAAKDRALLVSAKVEGELVQSRLGRETKTVHLVSQVGDPGPCRATVSALKYGEVVWLRARKCCGGQDSAIGATTKSATSISDDVSSDERTAQHNEGISRQYRSTKR